MYGYLFPVLVTGGQLIKFITHQVGGLFYLISIMVFTKGEKMELYILFRFSKRTGKVDTTMTGLGSALMQIWALNNTTKTKCCMIFERSSGKCVFITEGTGEFPKVKKGDNLGTCEDYGITLHDLHSIKDERFDEVVE